MDETPQDRALEELCQLLASIIRRLLVEQDARAGTDENGSNKEEKE